MELISELDNRNDTFFAFGKSFISSHPVPWPPSERSLADYFVSYFKSSHFLTVADLELFCTVTEIELAVTTLPHDLLGINYSLNGKRSIELSAAPHDIQTRVPTVLHEIRELLEYTFRNLGRPTTNSEEIELRAEEFASSVMEFGGIRMICERVQNPNEMEAALRKGGSFALIAICALALITRTDRMCPHFEFNRLKASPGNVT